MKKTADRNTIFSDGYESGRSGAPRTTVPHHPYSRDGLHWFLGWFEGRGKRMWAMAETDKKTLGSGKS